MAAVPRARSERRCRLVTTVSSAREGDATTFSIRDPNETLSRNMEATGLSLESPRMQTVAEMWRSVQDLPRHPRPALRRDGRLSGRSRLGGAARARQHARPRRHSIGTRTTAPTGHRQSRSARPRAMMAVLQDAIEMIIPRQLPLLPTPTPHFLNSQLANTQSRKPRAQSPLRSRSHTVG